MEKWLHICRIEDIPVLGARRFEREDGMMIAIFRNANDKVFALQDKCPHKGGPLSQGIVYGDKVACPMHSWKISLVDGKAEEPDVGETACFNIKIEDGFVYLELNN